MIDVEEYFARYEESPWDCASGLLWPKDFTSGEFGREHDAFLAMVNPSQDHIDYWKAAEEHRDTIAHFMVQLGEFRGREHEIPDNFAVILENGELKDGFHRLTAAKLLGLQSLPATPA